MAKRFAGAISLIAFAMCLVLGIQADNSFSTTVSRALVAMVVTFVIGLIAGAVGQKMLDDNLKSEEERMKNQSPTPPDGR